TGVHAEERIKHQILRELNQASLVDIAAIYADLNKHLTQIGVMPQAKGQFASRRGDRPRPPPKAPGDHAPRQSEVDVMSLFRKMASSSSVPMPGRAPPPEGQTAEGGGGGAGGGSGGGGSGSGGGDGTGFPKIDVSAGSIGMPGSASTFAPLQPTPT